MMVEPARLMAVDMPAETAPEFRKFFEAEHDRLGRALYLLIGNASEAEDLAQEAMVRVCERWDRVGRMDSPVGYLYRTAFNLNRKRVRRLGVQARRLFGLRPPSDHALSSVEDRDEIDRLLASIPEGQRQALILIDWLGLTDQEAGAVLGIEPVSVRVRVSRAHATLRANREMDDV